MMKSMSRTDSLFYLATDLDDDRSREDAARQALLVFGDLLDGASYGLQELQRNDMLGSAIVRKCRELADTIGTLADELNQQSEEERRALAQACLRDAAKYQNEYDNLYLQNENETFTQQQQRQKPLPSKMSSISEDEMMEALSGVSSLLVDVQGALRSIGQDEADEIADVAITVARLFVASVQTFYKTITPQQLAGTAVEYDDRIVLLNEDGTPRAPSPRNEPEIQEDRVRVLWPPLGPAVGSVLDWSKERATQQPLLAVALGLVLWPAAIVTACVSTPLVLCDGLVQITYNHFQEGPLVSNIEKGAAQVYHASRLALLCSGLVWRQSWRVANRQLERHGGPQKVLNNLGGLAVERVSHPVETACMTWDGITWGFGVLRDTVSVLHQVASREMEKEMDKTCQSLQ